ncbi:MAG: riboflavin synthase [Bacteroides sp.]|nr:riboflavin synthase [Bacteroides sp.]MCM1549531.1 riboflavin synthase [Clostridium sp.]
MFTGIIEETGTVKKIIGGQASGYMEIKADKVLSGTRIGDSIAVNGVCLTVTQLHSNSFVADVMAETLRNTNLGSLPMGASVNLERAMAANGRFGGHIVSGHIDGTGEIRSLQPEGNAVWVTISAPASILHLIVNKGSIAIDGISLTVAYVDDSVFKVSIIPHTGEETTLLRRKPGDVVNLENDVIGKYVEKLLLPYSDKDEHAEAKAGKKDITMDFLKEHGF